MTILETFIKLRDDLKLWVTNNLNQKANISYVDEKFNSISEFDPTEIQKAIDANAAAIDTKYTKPETGIPESDLSVGVRNSLALANTAIQEHQDISGKLDAIAQAVDSAKLNGKSAEYYLDYDNFINTPTIPSIEGLATESQIGQLQSDIVDNKTAIEKIKGDYLTSTDKTQLQDSIDVVSKKATTNADAIKVLNGEGDGSVKQSIDNAFNEFAAKVSDDKVVNTYKELIDYAAEHGPQFTELVGKVDDVDNAIDNHVIDTNNPHNVTKSQVGLDQVDNTSDLDKPISKAMDEALQGKADSEHTHEIGQIDRLQDLLDGLQTGIDTLVGEVETKADEEHDHEDLYYDKEEILGLITVEDINDICESNISSGDNIDIVSMATQYWVEQFYQPKGNYITGQDMSTHNTSTESHNDIRLEIKNLRDALEEFLECDDETIKQIQDVIDYINDNDDIIEGITSKKVDISDIINNLNTNDDKKPLSAAQGVVLKGLIDALQTEINNKAVVTDKSLSTSNAPADAKAVGDAIKNLDNTKVSTTRKINGKALSEDINLTPEDIGVVITTDKNLNVEGMPADAKAVGNALGNYAKTSDVEALVAGALDNVSNVVKYDVAQDLTDEQKAQARANIGVEDVDIEIDEIQVQLGENGTIGGYKTGDIIAAGTDIKTILNKLLQKAIPAEYNRPKLKLSNNGGTKNENVEAGSTVTPKLRATFIKNDSGGLVSIKIKQGETVKISGDGTKDTLDYNGESFVIGDGPIKFTAEAEYSAAPVQNNNLGEESKEDWFDDDTVASDTYTITGSRYLFCGTGTGELPTITSDLIRGLGGKKLAPANGYSFNFNLDSRKQYIIVAYPKSLNDISDITYVNINDPMLANFTKSEIEVADARGGDNGKIPYKVYTYSMVTPATVSMTFKFTIQK